MRDFALFDALVEKFSSEYCIDEDNIYVVGHSLGAWFTNSLSCARGDVIRATGSVGGSTTNNVCTGPVSSLIMHNPSDRLASFSGGEWARDQSVAQNGCDPDTFVSVGPAEGNCVAYTQCLNETEVVRCPHTQDYAWWDGSYYPHTWPDFAGEQIWDFFETHE